MYQEVNMNCPHCNNFVPENNYKCPKCGKAVQEVLEPTEFKEKSKRPMNSNFIVMGLIVTALAVLVYLMVSSKEEKEIPIPQKTRIAKTTTPTVTPTPTPANDADNNLETNDQSTIDNGIDPPSDSDENTEDNADDTTDDDLVTVGYVVNAENPGSEVHLADYVQADQITIFDFYSKYCPPCLKISPFLKELDEKRDDIIVFKIDINRNNVRGIDFRSPVSKQYGLKFVPHFVIYNKVGEQTLNGRPAYNRVMQMLTDEGITGR